MRTILAAPNLLKIENIALYSDEVRLIMKTRPLKSACPSCGQHSSIVHSRYQRHLADLPWEGIAAKLVLSVRKFLKTKGAELKLTKDNFVGRLLAIAGPDLKELLERAKAEQPCPVPCQRVGREETSTNS
jgi:transposase